jgi:hypothetical protein
MKKRNELKILADRYYAVMIAWKLRRLILAEIAAR